VTDAPNIPLREGRSVPFACYLFDLNSTDRFDAKPDRHSDRKHDKNRQNNELPGPKWLLSLCRNKRADIWLSVLQSLFISTFSLPSCSHLKCNFVHYCAAVFANGSMTAMCCSKAAGRLCRVCKYVGLL
jgi:hypothetical protein